MPTAKYFFCNFKNQMARLKVVTFQTEQPFTSSVKRAFQTERCGAREELKQQKMRQNTEHQCF